MEKKFLLVNEKKIRVVKTFHLVHEKKDQGGKKLPSDPVLLIDTTLGNFKSMDFTGHNLL